MFGGRKTNFHKLKTNLRLCINRLKLMEKKKTELALKGRKEIAEYIQNGKEDRARIRVENIVREDYLVEAMEIVELFCDLLLARFGLIERMAEMDPGLEEAISTIFWVCPRMNADIPELQEVSNQLAYKYGKEFSEQCRTNALENVNEKVMHKMSIYAPPAILIEQYMIEIAKSYSVPFEPDPTLLNERASTSAEQLISFSTDDENKTNERKEGRGPRGGGASGGGSAPPPMQYGDPAKQTAPPGPVVQPNMAAPFAYPRQPMAPPAAGMPPPAPGFVDSPPVPGRAPNANAADWGSVPPPGNPPPGPGRLESLPPYSQYEPTQPANPPPPAQQQPQLPNLPELPPLPELPSVPAGGSVAAGGEEVDFDDLTRRFEELKKKK